MYSAYKLNKQGDSIQPWHTPFPIWNQSVVPWLLLLLAAKSLQSCPTLCDPIDASPPGPSVHGIFQARVLEWGAIAMVWRPQIFWNMLSLTLDLECRPFCSWISWNTTTIFYPPSCDFSPLFLLPHPVYEGGMKPNFDGPMTETHWLKMSQGTVYRQISSSPAGIFKGDWAYYLWKENTLHTYFENMWKLLCEIGSRSIQIFSSWHLLLIKRCICLQMLFPKYI